MHVEILKSVGADVACFDVVQNEDCVYNYDAKDAELVAPYTDGYKIALVSL